MSAKNLSNLLSDAAEIQWKTPLEQERIIAELRAEIEANNRKIAALQAQGATLGQADSAALFQTMSAYSRARQVCPHCAAAQTPPPQVNLGCCAPPQTASATTAVVPFRATPQTAPYATGYPTGYPTGGGLFDAALAGLSDQKMLVAGARGAEVKRLQSLLRLAGYNVKADGIFGEKTERALIAFQQANGLRADGRAKQVDFQKLDERAGEKSGANARALAGKNDAPTPKERAGEFADGFARNAVPLIIGAGTGAFVHFRFLRGEQSNVRKIGLTIASAVGACAVSYVGVNAVADALQAPSDAEV